MGNDTERSASRPEAAGGEPATYFIRALTDFRVVPPLKLGDCLLDFYTWVSLQDTHSSTGVDWSCFIWKDDGLHPEAALLCDRNGVETGATLGPSPAASGNRATARCDEKDQS